MHIDGTDQLSFGAVGLWHKLHYAYGSRCNSVDVLTVHPDLHAWGPEEDTTDPSGPMDELLALGFIEQEGPDLLLHEEVEL
ncbi:hypothetical protein GCM10009706_14110 [Curtobacterium citreum]|uniref:Uncharacterized protein n=1 Tax=Curtobacterium citreum TaxID=2036 RepID=A0ABT2HDL6_9MICO|nr:hypothetical protein [Curtobacterium citreum]MCS6521361.1 hypothetical protein [Curtobacterium citreum]TQJ28220.1 hypothetical protein FB462_2100 [Curtobacterium citreum]GGL76841.1 hypothetical protein GCM10009706_14110 [Curtobacterium citreum]